MNYNNINDIKHGLKIKSNKNKDIILILLFSIIVFIIFIKIDFFELLVEFTRDHEEYELDEIITLFFISGFFALWYSIRRHKEINKVQEELKKINLTIDKQLKFEIQRSNETLNRLNEQLKNENKEQNTLLTKNSKMILMGEMMENIVHQWRQPLSAISMTAGGIKIQYDFSHVDQKTVIDSCNSIISYTEYLSHTIDDFKDFFKEDKEKDILSLEKDICPIIQNILNKQFKIKDITIIKDLNDAKIYGYKNELIQVIINIFNNSKDELLKINDSKRYIFITSYNEKNNIIIKIKDNAKGVQEELLDSIYQQHFTTKQNNDGTGIGLYMCKNIIQKSFNGTISSNNVKFNYKNQQYHGLETIITIPLVQD